jgi:hypothetical protein
VIVLGTGLKECILSGLLSVDGLKVCPSHAPNLARYAYDPPRPCSDFPPSVPRLASVCPGWTGSIAGARALHRTPSGGAAHA